MTNATYRGVFGDFWMVLSPGDDSLHWFKRNTNGTYASPQDENLLLSAVSGGWQVEAPGKVFYAFDTNLVLTGVSNLVGNTLSLTYTNWGATRRLARVGHNNGLALDFAYTNGVLTQVLTSDAALHVDYSYNTNGTLASSVRTLTGPDETNTYKYAADGLTITQRVKSNGDASSHCTI